MKVLYTCDNNYIWLMGISTISLFENNKEIDELEVYLLGKGITYNNKNILSQIGEKYGRSIIIIDVPEFEIPDSLRSARWPLSACTRLCSGELGPSESHRLLYLDCDTIICGKLDEINNWDTKEKIFWGVKDCIGSTYKKNIGMKKNKPYVNAGVLIIDLVNLRRIDIRKAIDKYMGKYERLISYADQDILNGIFKEQIGYLPPKYNVMTIDIAHSYREIQLLRRPTGFYSKEEMEEAIKNPRIIHFTTNMLVIRPWFINSDHPLKEEFDKYYEMSPWNRHEKKKILFGHAAKVIRTIRKLPDCIAYRILGLIHSELKPRYTKIRAKG